VGVVLRLQLLERLTQAQHEAVLRLANSKER
jgi:hypothetical protein